MTLTTLSPLPGEIIALIWDHLIAEPSTNVLYTSSEAYREGVRALYSHVTLSASNARSFFYGLGGEFGKGLGGGDQPGIGLISREDIDVLGKSVFTLTLLDGESTRQCEAACRLLFDLRYREAGRLRNFGRVFMRIEHVIFGAPLVREIIASPSIGERVGNLCPMICMRGMRVCILFPEDTQPNERAMRAIAALTERIFCEDLALHGVHPRHLVGIVFRSAERLRIDVRGEGDEQHRAQVNGVKAHCKSVLHPDAVREVNWCPYKAYGLYVPQRLEYYITEGDKKAGTVLTTKSLVREGVLTEEMREQVFRMDAFRQHGPIPNRKPTEVRCYRTVKVGDTK
ncbi:hypothetical protein IAT38_002659 [Cryptococcus sp. DSM 104549]